MDKNDSMEEQWRDLPEAIKTNIEQAAREDHWENIVSLMESSVVAFDKMVHHICKLSLEDPLVNVLIAFKKTALAVDVVGVIKNKEDLETKNFKGDTALHVAASVENITVARALLDRNPRLIFETNNVNETPLHKAALNGHNDIFWELIVRGSDIFARRKDGTTILHCAVIENHFGLALEIAQGYPDLIELRDQLGLTILHHMVTMTEIFLVEDNLSPLEKFLYERILLEKDSTDCEDIKTGTDKKRDRETREPQAPVEKCKTDCEDIETGTDKKRDRETGEPQAPVEKCKTDCEDIETGTDKKRDIETGESQAPVEKCLQTEFPMGSKYGIFGRSELLEFDEKSKRKNADEMLIPTNTQSSKKYFSISGLVLAVNTKTSWLITHLLKTLNQQSLIVLKRENENALKLLHFVANKSGYWTSLSLGSSYREINRQESKPDNPVERWMETPLTLSAKMGLDHLVLDILNEHPGAAKYLGKDGKNVLHVAVQYRRVEILKLFDSKDFKDPRLRTWLTSGVDYFGNTILHFAARPMNKTSSPLQMTEEFKWFERVMKLLPRELVHHRNDEGKTAQELFSESHNEMVEDGKKQLTNTARTCCAALVSAITFAAGFSIVSDQEKKGKNGTKYDQLAFKIFSHAYVCGLTCGAVALSQFMALLMSKYNEQDFRHSVPSQYFLAIFSLFLAMLSMLIAFACNTYVSLLGGRHPHWGNVIPMVLEITSFPIFCFLLLRFQGIRCSLPSVLSGLLR